MNYFFGNIPVSWTLSAIEDLDYFFEEFNDPDTIRRWNELYGPVWHAGLQADFRREQPAFTEQIIEDLKSVGLELDKIGSAYYKMIPGQILPYHKDTYLRYRNFHNVDIDDIWRAIVFIQDWQPGFVCEIDGKPHVEYKAGSFAAWQGSTPHMVANLGTVPRYTLQITGIRR